MADAGLELLLREITARAGEEREKILSDARTEAGMILDSAEAEIRDLEAESERRLERRLRHEKELMENRLRTKERLLLLAAKRAWLLRAFDAAGKELEELCRSPAYPEILSGLVGEALSVTGPEAELVVSCSDEAFCRELRKARGDTGTVLCDGDVPGTVRASSRDGLLGTDNCMATRLRKAEETMEADISRLLFGDGAEIR